MDDLISRGELMQAFADFVRRSNNSDFAPAPRWNDAVQIAEQLPSAQPKRKGRWIYHESLDVFECSVCGRQMVRNIFDYCPRCGAKMEP